MMLKQVILIFSSLMVYCMVCFKGQVTVQCPGSLLHIPTSFLLLLHGGLLFTPMVKNNADLLDSIVIWKIGFLVLSLNLSIKVYFGYSSPFYRFVVHGSSNTTFQKLFPWWSPQPGCSVILGGSFLSLFLHHKNLF